MVKSSPKFSIIVPVYNTGKVLPRCINSILAQSFSDFELLLIDDGSKDDSLQVCQEYAEKDNRIRVFHKDNGGVSSARNFGIEKALGEWLVFVDSDDTVKVDYIKTFADLSDKGDVLYQGLDYVAPDNTVSYSRSQPSCYLEGESLFELFFKMCNNEQGGNPYLCAFKNEIIKSYNIKFNVLFKLREDIEFISRYFSYIHSMNNSNYCGYNYYYPIGNDRPPRKQDFWMSSYSTYISILNVLTREDLKREWAKFWIDDLTSDLIDYSYLGNLRVNTLYVTSYLENVQPFRALGWKHKIKARSFEKLCFWKNTRYVCFLIVSFNMIKSAVNFFRLKKS